MGETELARSLRARIARDGPMPFHDFMAEALAAYYAKGPAIGGPGADFSTSVRFEAFRLAIARFVEKSGYSRVVELGAGTGQLARTVLEQLPHIEYVTVDASPGLRQKQRAAGARSVATMAEIQPGPSLVFGNEVLDALPVRRVVGGASGELLEIVLDANFRERLAPLRDARVAKRLEEEGITPQRGQILDVAPALEEFVTEAARLCEPGLLAFIDYGDVAERLYASDKINGTLAAYQSHGKHHDVYDEVGNRDITADVDFTAVARAAEAAGLTDIKFVSQQRFLEDLGIHELGLPDEAAMVAGPARLGTAFQVLTARRP